MGEAKLENRSSQLASGLETERLLLRPWDAEDWIGFRPIATDPEVMRYITGGVPWTDEQIREFAGRQMRHFAERGFCLWKLLAREQADRRIIGFCGLQPIFIEGEPEVEIGWWLAKTCWGKGLATEAARAVMQFGAQQAKLKRIVAIARAENTASLRVMQKLGMAYERDTIHKDVPVVLHSIGFPDASCA